MYIWEKKKKKKSSLCTLNDFLQTQLCKCTRICACLRWLRNKASVLPLAQRCLNTSTCESFYRLGVMYLGLWHPMRVRIIPFNAPTTPLPLPVSTSQNNENTGIDQKQTLRFVFAYSRIPSLQLAKATFYEVFNLRGM